MTSLTARRMSASVAWGQKFNLFTGLLDNDSRPADSLHSACSGICHGLIPRLGGGWFTGPFRRHVGGLATGFRGVSYLLVVCTAGRTLPLGWSSARSVAAVRG